MLVWCSSDLNVTLPQLQLPDLWWNKLLTGEVNNGLGLSATSAFLGKELSSPMNFICQVAQLLFFLEKLNISLWVYCSRIAPESLNAYSAKLMYKISAFHTKYLYFFFSPVT